MGNCVFIMRMCCFSIALTLVGECVFFLAHWTCDFFNFWAFLCEYISIYVPIQINLYLTGRWRYHLVSSGGCEIQYLDGRGRYHLQIQDLKTLSLEISDALDCSWCSCWETDSLKNQVRKVGIQETPSGLSTIICFISLCALWYLCINLGLFAS